MKLADIIQIKRDRQQGIILAASTINKLIDYALAQASIQANKGEGMNTIKTLDERIDAAAGVTVTVAEQLEMSRAEVGELKQALADSNLALMEQTELADKCRKQAETLEAERDQARAALEVAHARQLELESPPAMQTMEATPQQHAQAALSDQQIIELAGEIFNFKHWKQTDECKAEYVAFANAILATRQPAPTEQQLQTMCQSSFDAGKAYGELDRAAPVAAAVQGDAKLSEAAFDVLAERERQIKAEGMERQYDDKYRHGELRRAAAVYAYPQVMERDTTIWPWAQSWMKHTNPRRDAVKAAALLIAEIERIDRLAAQPHKKD